MTCNISVAVRAAIRPVPACWLACPGSDRNRGMVALPRKYSVQIQMKF